MIIFVPYGIYAIGEVVMQKATFAITIPHFFPHQYLHSLQKANQTSITSHILRFNVHETFQINPSSFLIFNNTFIQGL